jgi:glycosyltransferase involved in cell wall biosynthesis
MRRPLISCIVPAYNAERFLKAALDSILGQTYSPLEVIVVDDGSTDGTAGVVRGYGGRVRSLRQANAGHASARNAGVRAARGELVAFLDADDLWHREKLERQELRFRARPELGLCFTLVRNFRDAESGGDAAPREDAAQAVPGYSSVTLLARRGLFGTVGIFDPELRHGNDRDWFLRAADARVPMELLREVLVYRRLHEHNRSSSMASASRSEYLRILKASLDRRRADGRGRRGYAFHSDGRSGTDE